MFSLSEELVKLSELFTNGILSEDEFKTAKDAIIRRFAAPPQSSQASPPEQSHNERQEQAEPLTSSFGAEAYSNGLTSLEGNSRASFRRIDVREFDEGVIGEAQRSNAYKLLETIIHNLQKFPHEPKYRRLRLSHPVLRAQLFDVPGSVCFLRSLGFAPDLSGEFLSISHPPPCDLLTEATEAIAFLHRRDAEALSRTREHVRLRQSFGLEIRRERCAKAKSIGEFRAYLVQEFCADDAGDGLFSSEANLSTLRTILSNASDPHRRRLRLANPSVHRAVVQQRGGLELLLDGAAAELQKGPDGGPVLVLSAAPSDAAEGLRLIEEVAAAVHEARDERRRKDRETAAEAMRAEVRRARQSEEARRRREEGPGEDEEAAAAETTQQRRRIPVAEAVQILLGKKRYEDDAEK